MASALRGAVGAMAMAGMRRITRGFGLLPKVPPEEVFEEGIPGALGQIPVEHRDEAVELAHWGYGAVAGAAFALLPRRARGGSLAGAAYGPATWLAFEAGVAPLLRLRTPRQRTAAERAALVADHLLYGLVLAPPARPD